ncbi:mycofactocin-coupled SDR family oxidoreductase [Blastococcus sp. TML/M2B]|uniref:mycofactocin-coupled SDR family oxidoreductase n=1 Tax=unclassified Blastococcus TaxID=2619396 RepID=UPI00190E449B|nr:MULTISPECIES: mycofactocin-coupled SDR family oxidoreductase [unclassified Blastococcus]MBN1092776.1 mycofactocin-coupled SDR family oxidoreductase [Blastococcus sp. TML/M2B]MBN1097113.1 mycofactocin-coupled SDR family oxidoreductase [Blastococcus sp. TML/C7B]
MAGRVEGKVAFITGAARSQGRSHALRLAQEGADIIAVDIAGPVPSIQMFPPATEDDLAETVRQVEALDRRIVATKADVRNSGALKAAVDEGVAQLGRLDIVLANAGVFEIQPALEVSDDAWREMIDINLTGVWNTCKVALPHLIEGGRGGAMVLTSSTAGLKGTPNTIHYTAAKHGVVGIMRTLANEFAQHSIRVNSVHPTGVDTVMIQNEKTWGLFAPDDPAPSREKAEPIFQSTNALPVPWVEPVDISNAILFLVSDEARYITGVTLPVDAGYTVK